MPRAKTSTPKGVFVVDGDALKRHLSELGDREKTKESAGTSVARYFKIMEKDGVRTEPFKAIRKLLKMPRGKMKDWLEGFDLYREKLLADAEADLFEEEQAEADGEEGDQTDIEDAAAPEKPKRRRKAEAAPDPATAAASAGEAAADSAHRPSDAYDPEDQTMKAGYMAGKQGYPKHHNKHNANDPKHTRWLVGWYQAQDEAEDAVRNGGAALTNVEAASLH